MSPPALPYFPEQIPGPRATAGRLALAVAASAGLHLWLAAFLALDAPRHDARSAGSGLLEARLEALAPAAVPDAVPAPPVVPRQRSRAASGSDSPKSRAAARVQATPAETTAPALPAVPDPTYYAARDLDVYPRPVAPLDLARFAAGAAGRHRLALTIDETGRVTTVAAVGGERVQEELRATLEAARFHPARREGRAVRSRVLLELDLGGADGAAGRR